ncbi:MAG: glutathione S-transferase-like protein [Osedax symbiont Rs2]|nr:MAG: glutathione S-transferase-like protein [Osedax symbiont Rs2]
MGLLIEGQWSRTGLISASNTGKFVRQQSQFRNWLTVDGSPGATGVGGFKAEPDRYHLYVSLACPWAHRTLILRALKGLEQMISVSVVNALMDDDGWSFKPGLGVIEDNVNGVSRVHQLYTLAQGDYCGRASVPILWDKQQQTIVSNESADIIRMFNSAFDQVGATAADYYPQLLRSEIDAVNAMVYSSINNGVYKTGFATTQFAYTEAVTELFDALDSLEQRLTGQRYLTGGQVTEADWRLFTSLIRFDAVYVGHFKCNLKRIVDYPALSNYLRDLYQMPAIAATVDMPQIKAHYYASHTNINPTAIIPVGPQLNLMLPHNRANLSVQIATAVT